MEENQQEKLLSSYAASGFVTDKRVLAAMRKVKREDFLPSGQRGLAWMDCPLPIGHGQTMSAPHMYAFMLQAGKIEKGQKILEIGTGSGYGTALLAEMAGKKGKVVTVELLPELAEFARKNLKRAGYDAKVVVGDGRKGCADYAPYGRIFVTAAAEKIPDALLAQLMEGGRMLIPLGRFVSDLVLVEKAGGEARQTCLMPVAFVPLR